MSKLLFQSILKVDQRFILKIFIDVSTHVTVVSQSFESDTRIPGMF